MRCIFLYLTVKQLECWWYCSLFHYILITVATLTSLCACVHISTHTFLLDWGSEVTVGMGFLLIKSFLLRVKQESEKAGLKFNIQKTKIMASSPITSWQIDVEKSGNNDRCYFLKSLWTVTGGMKLKVACSLEEKLWQT